MLSSVLVEDPWRHLSPEGAFLAIILAILIDCWGIGGPKFAPLFDRLAFIGWVAGWAVGFRGAGLTELLTGILTAGFQWVADLWSAPLFVGAMHIGPQIIGWVVAGVTVGALAPARVKFLGKLSNIEFAHLRQAGTAAMARTGLGAGGAPAAPRSGGMIRKLFPGSINVGMVALALLFVTGATIVQGGIGEAMSWGVTSCVQICGAITKPLLASTGSA